MTASITSGTASRQLLILNLLGNRWIFRAVLSPLQWCIYQYGCIFFYKLCLEMLYLNKLSILVPKTWIHITSLTLRPGKTEFLSLTASSFGKSCTSFKLRQCRSPVDLQMLHQTGIQLPQCEHAQKLKLKQLVPPTTAGMPVTVLLCVCSLPKWSPEIPSNKVYDSVTRLVRLSRFSSGCCFPRACTATHRICVNPTPGVNLPKNQPHHNDWSIFRWQNSLHHRTARLGEWGSSARAGWELRPGAGNGTSPFRGS